MISGYKYASSSHQWDSGRTRTRSKGFILVTHNLREFQRVPGLRVEDWV
jgi:hypothetical protein